MDKAFSVILPMVDRQTRVGEALLQAERNLVGAVVSKSGNEFWLYNRSDLIAKDPSSTLGTLHATKV